jgi:ABC-type maltose transport system permease subunit
VRKRCENIPKTGADNAITPAFLKRAPGGRLHNNSGILIQYSEDICDRKTQTTALSQVTLDLEAEARLNGGGVTEILRHVVVPGIASGLAAVCVIVYVLSWNQYMIPLVLSGTQIRVIPVMLRDFFALEREFEWPAAAAVIMISLMPAGVVVAAFHRLLDRFEINPASDAS